jgi:membrane-bound ClpP family serine protease
MNEPFLFLGFGSHMSVLVIHSVLAMVELNTPGGSLDATLRITSLLRKSSVPVVGFVVERWAMSAGTIILMCTHYAAMEPGTVIGAVQPWMNFSLLVLIQIIRMDLI